MPLCALRCGAIASIKIISETLRDRTATAHLKCEATIINKTSQRRQQTFLLGIACEAYASPQGG